MFDVHYINMRPSWLLYYLGRIYEDEFISIAVKLGYPMKQKMNHITSTVMWQESNICKKYQRIVLRHLSDLFCTRLALLEYFIDKLGQNYIIPQYDFYISMEKHHFWTKLIFIILTTSFESLYYKRFQVNVKLMLFQQLTLFLLVIMVKRSLDRSESLY